MIFTIYQAFLINLFLNLLYLDHASVVFTSPSIQGGELIFFIL